MPTGYTHQVLEGCTFKQFIMSCARNFGALIDMRDEPMNAEIPEKFEVSDYYPQKIAALERELIALKGMPDDEVRRRYQAVVEDVRRYNREQRRNKTSSLKNYQAMLSETHRWQPPSPDHEELKRFMVSQLEQSIEWDCMVYEKALPAKSHAEWRQSRIDELERDITYSRKAYREEVERVESRNQWLSQLRSSLTTPEDHTP